MYLDPQRAHALVGATWLFGFAALFYTGYWWPGILFLVGVTSIVEGLVRGRGWYGLQGGLWAIGIGVWATLHYRLALFFVLIGISVLLGAFVRPSLAAKKPAPVRDDWLE
ncbi:MAG: hypothetical protein P4L84_25885 [Isosphaeraceae bacterium]|nr:hypothetical protein [Isosphaeraceae bacterium]